VKNNSVKKFQKIFLLIKKEMYTVERLKQMAKDRGLQGIQNFETPSC